MGIEVEIIKKETFKLMAKTVHNHEQKIVQHKGNNRSHPFKLSVEDQI